ncbi:NUDIX domain-containing protein [Candidatus Saccharibacteria bacterium]|nr:NUDIX domain-containing protein [Candidatus Saccharibacteria bacterium]
MATARRTYCYLCATKLEPQSDFSWKCPSCQYTQYENPKPATEVVLMQDGKILASERGAEPHKGRFDMPGGFIECNETIEEGLLRELDEELGISSEDITGLRYLRSYSCLYPFGKEVYYLVVMVYVATLGAGVKVEAKDDVASLRWVSEAEIDSVLWSLDHHLKNARTAFRNSE